MEVLECFLNVFLHAGRLALLPISRQSLLLSEEVHSMGEVEIKSFEPQQSGSQTLQHLTCRENEINAVGLMDMRNSEMRDKGFMEYG